MKLSEIIGVENGGGVSPPINSRILLRETEDYLFTADQTWLKAGVLFFDTEGIYDKFPINEPKVPIHTPVRMVEYPTEDDYMGLLNHNDSIWVVGRNSGILYQFAQSNGQEQSRLTVSGGSDYTDVHYTDKWWFTSGNNECVYYCDSGTAITETIPLPDGITGQVTGICDLNGSIWITGTGNIKVRQLGYDRVWTSNFINIPNGNYGSISSDGTRLWVYDRDSKLFKQVNSNGTFTGAYLDIGNDIGMDIISVCYRPGGNMLAVTNNGDRSINRFTSTLEGVGEKGIVNIPITPAGTSMYVRIR